VHLKGLEILDGHIWNLVQLVHAYASLGQIDLAEIYYQEMIARYEKQYLPPSVLAMTAAKLGDVDRALRLAQEAVDINDPLLFNTVNNFWPTSEDLNRLAGFKEIAENFWLQENQG
jgi:tetratricopeptide (TPR) repeat protein